MRTIIIATILSASLSCSRDSGRLPTKLLVGVNDTAIYHLDRDGRTAAVEKVGAIVEAYSHLHRDTVQLGETFRAYLEIFKDKYEIIITKPTLDTLTREDKTKEFESLKYQFKTTQRGTFDFEGEFRYDSTVRPFHWKFIVI